MWLQFLRYIHEIGNKSRIVVSLATSIFKFLPHGYDMTSPTEVHQYNEKAH